MVTPTLKRDGNAHTNERHQRVTKVFIVDDHPATREGLAWRLSAQCDFVICGEAAEIGEALRDVLATEPDLVIVDIGLRRGDGLELVKRLKERGNPPKMLVWSWRGESIFAERALRAGASGFISKSEPTAAILDAIRRVLAGDVYLNPEMMNTIVRRSVAGTNADDDADPVRKLANRELEVFQLMGQGMDTARIAEKLVISPKTVETYRARIKEKLGVESGNEMLVRAIRWAIANECG